MHFKGKVPKIVSSAPGSIGKGENLGPILGQWEEMAFRGESCYLPIVYIIYLGSYSTPSLVA